MMVTQLLSAVPSHPTSSRPYSQAVPLFANTAKRHPSGCPLGPALPPCYTVTPPCYTVTQPCNYVKFTPPCFSVCACIGRLIVLCLLLSVSAAADVATDDACPPADRRLSSCVCRYLFFLQLKQDLLTVYADVATDDASPPADRPLSFCVVRYLFFLQLKQDLLSGQLECPQETAIQLAALCVQCE